jgi:hypothetical protein
MIKSKTVFILGAGASYEAGMPVGTELAEQISKMLKPGPKDPASGRRERVFEDELIDGALLGFDSANRGRMVLPGQKISNCVMDAKSIDEFIDSFPNDPDIATAGKIAIARAILLKERESKLYVSQGPPANGVMDQHKLKDTWYPWLIRILSAEVNKESASDALANVTFVSFNYDRCLEQFLTYSLSVRLGLPMNEAEKLLHAKPVLHPYGALGPLNTSSGSSNLDFGQEDRYDLKEIAKNLKTYTEEIDDKNHELLSIRNAISKAETLIFLGFAFHKQNMELLKPNAPINARHIYATTYGMSESDRSIVHADLSKFWGANPINKNNKPEIVLSKEKCAQFMFDYQRAISG